jgi:hypothetical protein
MQRHHFVTKQIVILVLGVFLSACSPSTDPSPQNVPAVSTSSTIKATQVATSPVTQAITTSSPIPPNVPPTQTNSTIIATQVAISPVTQAIATSGLAIYRGVSSEEPSFSYGIRYDPSEWQYTDETTEYFSFPKLVHRHITDCYLQLDAGGTGAEFVTYRELADLEWSIYLINKKLLGYVVNIDNVYFLFDVGLPDEFSTIDITACQQDAEEVLDTFVVAGS